MNDGLFSKHAALNAGTIPVSTEELSERYTMLFQQYSQLKAQHTVLKKAVLKERAFNLDLQSNLKEKEKELRKLQEQLDLLSFHNERLTKRIQSVQEGENKGNYFSLLGGSSKKELEKNAQALDAANSDLERKILENERLHDEITERQFEFTENINNLLKQIQDLEVRIKELEAENMSLQTNFQDQESLESKESASSKEDELILKQKTDALTLELNEKTNLLQEQERKSKENDSRMVSEIHSLRAILIAKIGHMENEDLKDIFPESQSVIQELEKDAKQYIQSIGNKDSKSVLPHEIAEKLAKSHETWRKELERLNSELENKKKEITDLLEKTEQEKLQEDQTKEQIKLMHEKHEENIKQIEKEHAEKIEQLNVEHNEKVKKHLSEMEDIEKKVQELEEANKNLELENTKIQQKIEKIKTAKDCETQTDHIEPKEEPSIYPKMSLEEEGDVFVYTGVDAVPKEKTEEQDVVLELKTKYEKQIEDLTIQLQMSDSKAIRLEDMYHNCEQQLVYKEQNNQTMMLEIERLNKEVSRIQDLRNTTEKEYQKQLDSMTEMITSGSHN